MSVESSALSVGRSASTAAVDAANPWPGLSTFTEEQCAYFFGRDDEVRELSRRVERKALTVLFGQSGLGKSSLLQAGLFPRLRAAGFCPVYVRLDHAPTAPTPTDQIKSLVMTEAARAGTWTRPGSARDGESLWEFFHHRDDQLTASGGGVITPVLVFDQFEELFTLGASAAAMRERAHAFIGELAELVENRPTEALVARLEDSPADMEAFDFGRTDYRVLIALREDYLPHLEGLKLTMPALMQNRMRLARMRGSQALAAVVRPGAGLVSDAVAQAIVSFVAGQREIDAAEVEPSLLNLVCRELNNQRQARGDATISAALLAGTRDTILSEFYERALADQPPAVRHFIEDELLTDSGFRENVALERAQSRLSHAGAAAGAIDILVNRRLLRIEERLDVRRVELTHDVLCGVVKISRDSRHEREARDAAERQLAAERAREAAAHRELVRARQIAFVCAVLMLLAIASAAFGFDSLRRARAAEREQTKARVAAEAARNTEAGLRADAEANERTAETEAVRSAEVARFMKDILNGVGPGAARGRDTKLLRDILDTTAGSLDTDLKDQPEVVADLRNALGAVYIDLAEYTKAEAMLRESVRLRRALLGNEHPDTATSLDHLGSVLWRQRKLEEAERVHREALAIRQKLHGTEHADTARSMYHLSQVLNNLGKGDETLALRFETLAIRRRLFGEEHPDVAESLFGLGTATRAKGDLVASESYYRQSLAIRRKLLGNDHFDVADSLNSLGWTLSMAGKREEALAAYFEALTIRRKVLGDGHPDTLSTLGRYVNSLNREGRADDAIVTMREVIAAQRKVRGDDDPAVAPAMLTLANLLLQKGESTEEALALIREGKRLIVQSLATGQQSATSMLGSLNSAAWSLYLTGNSRQALDFAEMLKTGLRANWRATDRSQLSSLDTVAWVKVTGGRPAEAASDFQELIDAFTTTSPAGANATATIAETGGLGLAFRELGRLEDARRLLEDALVRGAAPVLEADDREFRRPETMRHNTWYLALTLIDLGEFAETEALLQPALAQTSPTDEPYPILQSLLGASLSGQRRFEEAEPLLLDGYKGLAVGTVQIRGDRTRYIREAAERLTRLYEASEKPDEATKWREVVDALNSQPSTSPAP